MTAAEWAALARNHRPKGVYRKTLSRHVRQTQTAEVSPQLIAGEPAPERFAIRENGLNYELSFAEGYSVGLFLDQRDNRRRLLTGHLAAHFPPLALKQAQVLNCFAYTCGFSVCAAQAGAKTTSLGLSKKHLEWGRRNFLLNGLDPAAHDCIFGDAFDWLRRLAKKAARLSLSCWIRRPFRSPRKPALSGWRKTTASWWRRPCRF